MCGHQRIDPPGALVKAVLGRVEMVAIDGIEIVRDADQPGGQFVVRAAGIELQRDVVLTDEEMILAARRQKMLALAIENAEMPSAFIM